jgi:FixJ family two-component response regulator
VTIGNTRSLPRLTERPFSGPAPDTAAGFNNQAIASQLFLSEHTVHRHVANMNHFAYAGTQETTIVLYGQGPVEFKYVKASDDPRNAKGATR